MFEFKKNLPVNNAYITKEVANKLIINQKKIKKWQNLTEIKKIARIEKRRTENISLVVEVSKCSY